MDRKPPRRPSLGMRDRSLRADGRMAVWQWGPDPDPESTIGSRWLLVDVRQPDMTRPTHPARSART